MVTGCSARPRWARRRWRRAPAGCWSAGSTPAAACCATCRGRWEPRRRPPAQPTRRARSPPPRSAPPRRRDRAALAVLDDAYVLHLIDPALEAAPPPVTGVGVGFTLADLDGDGEPEVIA